MSAGLLKSACLTVGLVSAWSPSVEADILSEVHFRTELAGGVTHARILLGSLGSGAPGQSVFLRDISLPGFGSGSFTSELPRSAFGDLFAVIGVFGEPGAQRLMVTAGGGSGLFGVAFEDAFPGASEPLLIDQLVSNDPAADAFLTSNFALMGIGQGLLNNAVAFSLGEPIGGIQIRVVSVPGPGAISIAALAFMPRRRRR